MFCTYSSSGIKEDEIWDAFTVLLTSGKLFSLDQVVGKNIASILIRRKTTLYGHYSAIWKGICTHRKVVAAFKRKWKTGSKKVYVFELWLRLTDHD